MGISLNDRERQLASSIQRYGFAATIEVTNALVDSDEKVGQSLVAKCYLEQLTDGKPLVRAGLAYNGNLVDPTNMNSLDFIIDLNSYDSTRLEGVTYEMLRGDYVRKGILSREHTELIEKMLESYREDVPLAQFLSMSGVDYCSGIVGESPREYGKMLSAIKGLCMELYIKSLFREEIEDCIIYHRHNFEYYEPKKRKLKGHEADEIVICSEDRFYSALERISEDDKFETWVKAWTKL